MRFLISVSHLGHLILGCNGSKILKFWCNAPRSDFFFRFVWKDGALELHVSAETGAFCNIIPGWWFGTWILLYDFPYSWECHHPNWRTPSFFRGVGWNHQPDTNIFGPIIVNDNTKKVTMDDVDGKFAYNRLFGEVPLVSSSNPAMCGWKVKGPHLKPSGAWPCRQNTQWNSLKTSYWYSVIVYGSVSKPCTPVVHIKIAGIYGCSSP